MSAEKKLLRCGHSADNWRILRYRCANARFSPGCRDIHTTGVCKKCFEQGVDMPEDYGWKVSLAKYRGEAEP